MDLSGVWTTDIWNCSHQLYHLSYQPLTATAFLCFWFRGSRPCRFNSRIWSRALLEEVWWEQTNFAQKNPSIRQGLNEGPLKRRKFRSEGSSNELAGHEKTRSKTIDSQSLVNDYASLWVLPEQSWVLPEKVKILFYANKWILFTFNMIYISRGRLVQR